VQGGFYLFVRENPTIWTRLFGLSAIIIGASLLLGFLTPLSSVIISLGSIFFIISTSSAINQNFFIIVYVFIISSSLALLGPGAFSLDARMFGRREIIIPDRAGKS
jgi:uncharacterized membrane protein YphA (DoxX/SURF4 family)